MNEIRLLSIAIIVALVGLIAWHKERKIFLFFAGWSWALFIQAILDYAG
jgi:hypothetical protein